MTVLKINDRVPDMIVCGADEKILRLLEPIPHFINYYNALSGNELSMNVEYE